MFKTKPRPTAIVILDFDGNEIDRIEIPPAPKLTLLERVRWRLHCWRTAVRNAVYWLKGGRW